MSLGSVNVSAMSFSDMAVNIKQKYADALVLYSNSSFANCYYLCGYCVELALKYKIAKYLRWTNFSTSQNDKTLKTHDLNLLLKYTGIIGLNLTPEWSIVKEWNETIRYMNPRTISQTDAQEMLDSTKIVVRSICKCLLKA